MLPDWIKKQDSNYTPPSGGGVFAVSTIRTLGDIMSRLKVQKGHEKSNALPATVKFSAAIALILTISVSHNKLVILAATALIQLYLCVWPAKDILSIIKSSFFASVLAFILVLPAMIMNPSGMYNNLMLVLKVFVSVECVSIFNHTTQWNHITSALRKIHIPSVFVFTLDISLKYIVISGNMISDLLTSLILRSVGKSKKEYNSVGGVMGVTFIRSTEMSKQMYEAMQCRGFTGDYKGL